MGFSENFSTIRKAKGINQSQIADKLGVTPQAVSAWEKGLTIPKTSIIIPLTNILGCTVNDLMGESKIELDALSFMAMKENYSPSPSEDEQLILDTYRSLSQIGKMKLYAYMESLK